MNNRKARRGRNWPKARGKKRSWKTCRIRDDFPGLPVSRQRLATSLVRVGVSDVYRTEAGCVYKVCDLGRSFRSTERG